MDEQTYIIYYLNQGERRPWYDLQMHIKLRAKPESGVSCHNLYSLNPLLPCPVQTAVCMKDGHDYLQVPKSHDMNWTTRNDPLTLNSNNACRAFSFCFHQHHPTWVSLRPEQHPATTITKLPIVKKRICWRKVSLGLRNSNDWFAIDLLTRYWQIHSRPKTMDDISSQEQAVLVLKKALQSDNVNRNIPATDSIHY